MTIRLDEIHLLLTQQAQWSVENSFTVSVVDEVVSLLRERIARKEVVGTICDLRDMMSMSGLEISIKSEADMKRLPALRAYIAKLKLSGNDREVNFKKTSMHIHSNFFSQFHSVLLSRHDFELILI